VLILYFHAKYTSIWFSTPSSWCNIWHTFHFLVQSNRTCAAVFFTRNYIWRLIFQFLVATKTQDLQLFFLLLAWMNVQRYTTISLLQWKLFKQFLLMLGTNCFGMVYFNFNLQCQHFDIFLFYQWNILLVLCFFLVTRVDISVKSYLTCRYWC